MVKNPPPSAREAGGSGSVPRLGRSGVGNGTPLRCSCLEDSMDRGAWGHKELDTTKQLSTYTCIPKERKGGKKKNLLLRLRVGTAMHT